MNYISRLARPIPRDSPPLAQMLRGCCYAVDETVPRGFHDGARRIAYCAVLFTVSGSSDYVIDEEKVTLTPGSLLILPPGISFSEKVPEPCHNRYLMLGGPLAREIAGVIPEGMAYAFWPRCPAEVAAILSRCVELAHKRPDVPRWRLGGELCLLVEAIVGRDPGRPALSPLPERVRELVLESVSKSWRVPEIARQIGMSESAFAHQFREQTGQTPAAFVRAIRCAAARPMLESGLTVAETAGRLGFKNPYHFSKVFASEVGMPPSRCIPDNRRLHRMLGKRGGGSSEACRQ